MTPLLLQAIWPLFALILAGAVLRWRGLPGPAFWPGAEHLNYRLLFPCLLFASLARAPLHDPALPGLLLAVALTLGLASTVLWLARAVLRWPAAQFGVLVQATLRFNTYLGLAIVGAVQGPAGLAQAAVLLGVLVPAVNVLAVLGLASGPQQRWHAFIAPVVSNPLVLSCAAGAAFNLAGGRLDGGAGRLFDLLAGASLPLGLLGVGACLEWTALRTRWRWLVGSAGLRLVGMPVLALACARWLGLPAPAQVLLTLFCALPTAPTAYVLTRQLGGDAVLMAALTSSQTLLSAFTLPWVLAMLRS